MDKIKIALIQMDSGKDKQENLQKAKMYLEQAAKEGADVVCFPEVMNGEAENQHMQNISESLKDQTIHMLCQCAKEHRLYIHSGSMYEKCIGDDKCYNTSVFLSREGKILDTYRKIHLFDAVLEDGTICKESHTQLPGNRVVTVDTDFGTVGMAICYDIRFPEMFRKMAIAGAKVIFVAASFTKETGSAHWEILLRARAIENACYIVACNQTGKKAKYTAYGNSMIIDPWGRILCRAGEEPGICMGEILLPLVDQVRKKIPVLDNRRTDVCDL